MSWQGSGLGQNGVTSGSGPTSPQVPESGKVQRAVRCQGRQGPLLWLLLFLLPWIPRVGTGGQPAVLSSSNAPGVAAGSQGPQQGWESLASRPQDSASRQRGPFGRQRTGVYGVGLAGLVLNRKWCPLLLSVGTRWFQRRQTPRGVNLVHL